MPGLEYNVKVNGAQQGAADLQGLAQATEKVAGSTGKAAPEAKGLAEALASLGSRNNPAKDALEGISTAARGGEGTIFGLTKAFKGFRELANGGLAALGPGGILVAGLGLVVGLLPKFIELINSGKKSTEELAADAKKAADQVTALGQAKLDGLQNGFDTLREREKAANEEMERTLKLQERMDNTERKAQLAEHPENADKINSYFEGRQNARTLTGKSFAAAQAEDTAKAAKSNQEDAVNGEVAALKKLMPLLEQQAAYEKQQKELNATVRGSDYNYILNTQGKRNAADPGELAEARAGLESAKKLTQSAADKAAMAQQEAERKRQAASDEKQGQSAEQNSEVRVKAANQKQATTQSIEEITKRRDTAGQRAQEASDKNDIPGQQEAAAEFKKASAELSKAQADLQPLIDSTASFTAAYSEASARQTEAVSSAATAIKKSVTEIPAAPDLTPIVGAITSLDSGYKERSVETNRRIDDAVRQIQQLAQQVSNSRS